MRTDIAKLAQVGDIVANHYRVGMLAAETLRELLPDPATPVIAVSTPI